MNKKQNVVLNSFSWLTNKLIKLREMVGNGRLCRFWTDNWSPFRSLESYFLRGTTSRSGYREMVPESDGLIMRILPDGRRVLTRLFWRNGSQLGYREMVPESDGLIVRILPDGRRVLTRLFRRVLRIA
ncbi:hypothetical protein HID58_065461 [Brassica napus]|uniref:Uncharacterized protein n=1 Tax=Brassica napus TaxID=3708 RepID=A0ABQ7ZCW3_BRANA|nr:hypothetical protein HID58_065461 [Brassica napus]